MTATLRERLAAVLGPGNDDATAYVQADAVIEVLAAYQRDTRVGICGNEVVTGTQCDLPDGHRGLHEGIVWPRSVGVLAAPRRAHWGTPS